MKRPNRIEVNHWELMDVRAGLVRSNVFFIAGTYSLYCPSVSLKWVDRDHLINWGEERLLPGEVAKYELSKAFPDLKRVGWNGPSVRLFSHRYPSFCVAEYAGPIVHIDLVAAYWNIYRWLWLDVGFPGGIGNLDLYPVAERLKDQKAARNAVIGLIRSRDVVGIKGERSFNMKATNHFLSPHLWATVVTYLNEVAWRARYHGAIYCMIDGYHFPRSADHLGFCEWLEDTDIPFRSVDGEGHVMGWGSWHIEGYRTTKPYLKGSRGKVNFIRRYAGVDTCVRFLNVAKFWRKGR